MQALYSSTSALNDLTFTYTVAEGNEDTDGIAMGANKLSANGGIIASNGKNADLAHIPVPASGHKVDGVRPTMTNAVSSADGTTIVVTFSETLSSARANYEIKDGALTLHEYGVNTTTVSGNTVTLVLNLALTYGETLALRASPAAARDSAGNANARQTHTITNEVTEPVAYLTAIEVSSTPGDDGTYVSQDTVQFTATFNNTVTVTGTPQLKFSLGGTANDGHRNADYASGSPGTELVFEYTVLATDESTAHGIGVRSDPINLNAGDITRNGNTVQLYRRSRGGDGTHRVNYAPPNFLSGATATDGMSIVLTFDQDLKGTTVPNAHFTVSVDGEAASLSGTTAAVSGTTVTLSLTDTLIGANKVTVSYIDPTEADDRLCHPGPARQRRRVVHRRHGDQHRRGRPPGRAHGRHGDHDPHPRRDARLDRAERHREHRNFGLPNRGLDRQRGELGGTRRPIPARPTPRTSTRD